MPKRSAVPCSGRSRWSEAQAREALEAHAMSGLSAREFAAREGLDRQRLYYWRRRLEGRPTRATPRPPVLPAFVEIRRRESTVAEMVLLSGRILRVDECIAPAALRQLLEVLEADAPC